VVVAYARSSGAKAYNELENLAKTSASEVERGRIYGGLTAFAEPDLVRRALEFGISGEVSRSDSAYTMTRAAANPDARDVLWRWLRDRYDRLWEIYGGSQQLFLYYEGIIPRCAVGKAAEVKRFFSGDRMAGGNIAFKRIQESVEVRSRLRKRLLDAK
jgi:aminopeptidase N